MTLNYCPLPTPFQPPKYWGFRHMSPSLAYQTATLMKICRLREAKQICTGMAHTTQEEDTEKAASSRALLRTWRRRLSLGLAPTWHASPPTPATQEKVRLMRHIPSHNGPSAVPVTFCPCPPAHPPSATQWPFIARPWSKGAQSVECLPSMHKGPGFNSPELPKTGMVAHNYNPSIGR